MASPTVLPTNDADQSLYLFPTNLAKECLKNTGAYVMEDASAGRRVDEFINRQNLPLRKPNGLDFCAQNSLYIKYISDFSQNVRDVIESTINQPHWGLAKTYNSDILPSDQAYFFLQGAEIRAIYILLFTPRTRFLLFEGSHERRIHGKVMSRFGLLTSPHGVLRKEGIAAVTHEMAKGGFALIDGRTGWTLLEGQEMVIGYASEAEIRSWGEYELGDTAALRDKVAELNRNGIKAKFKFVKPQIPISDV
ncbi:hypothetical protein GGR57DRAFT_489633 [Xylariaceae sp. FL1272]|nr:hypothetical protein GGR57DRAFT_489633 [Xylariaceae sp. FL1272]